MPIFRYSYAHKPHAILLLQQGEQRGDSEGI